MTEDDEPHPVEQLEGDRPSRTADRRARRTREDLLAELAKRLVEQSPRRLDQLDLPESVLDSIRDAQAISSPAARNRQLRVVRSALRESNWALLRARLDALLLHGAVPRELCHDEGGAATEHAWVARLLGEGPSAIEALVARCPTADRTHLKNLIRNAQKASGERRRKAEVKLAETVRSLLHRR